MHTAASSNNKGVKVNTQSKKTNRHSMAVVSPNNKMGVTNHAHTDPAKSMSKDADVKNKLDEKDSSFVSIESNEFRDSADGSDQSNDDDCPQIYRTSAK